MSEKEIFQKLKTIVVDHLGVNEENVTMEATFVVDLAADTEFTFPNAISSAKLNVTNNLILFFS